MPLFASILLFLSGFAALCYEVLWVRQFGRILGSTAAANSAVFSAFLVAMALGAYGWSRLGVRGRRARKLYALLEFGAGISAAFLTLSLRYWETSLAALVPLQDGAFLLLGKQFFLALTGLGIPGMLMGATLPVLVDSLSNVSKSTLPWLYGVNTLGASCGALISGGLLLWKLGVIGTLVVAVTCNLTAGLLALFWTSEVNEQSSPHKPSSSLCTPSQLGIAFASGFLVLGFEVIWARLSRFILGERTIAVAVLLSLFLASLGLASLLAGRLSEWKNGLGKVSALAAIVQVFALLGASVFLHQESSTVTARVGQLVVIMTVPVMMLGTIFPLLLCNVREAVHHPGRILGHLYLINTLGAVAGALSTTYIMTQIAGTFGAGIVLIVLAALLSASLSLPDQKLFLLTPVVAGVLGATLLPSRIEFHRQDEAVVAYREDAYGVQQVVEKDGNLSIRSNRLQLIAPLGLQATDEAQQMAAHWPALLAEKSESILNIGTGYGITVGTFTHYPQFESIESVELLPFVADHQELFSKFNFEYWKDPRTKLIVGDGRHRLLSAKKRYDIITVNVLDPYLPGSSSLYTVDFWREARSRLEPGGVYTQLIWGEHAYLLAKGFESVFPEVYYFPAYSGACFNVVAFKDKAPEEWKKARLTPAASAAISRFTNASVEEYLSFSWQSRTDIRRRVLRRIEELGNAPLHTNDHPYLEYTWGLSGQSPLDSPLSK